MSKERLKNNMVILNKLKVYLEEHKDLRFIQALWALGIVNNEDRFYEEPKETLEKMKKLEEFKDEGTPVEDVIDMISGLFKK